MITRLNATTDDNDLAVLYMQSLTAQLTSAQFTSFHQAWFYVGAGRLTPNILVTGSQHCLTKSKHQHQHIGAKGTPKCVFGRGSAPDSTGGAHDATPEPTVGWGGVGREGERTPLTIPYSSALSSAFGARLGLRGAMRRFEGALPPNICL